jgi:hypothetical protein
MLAIVAHQSHDKAANGSDPHLLPWTCATAADFSEETCGLGKANANLL